MENSFICDGCGNKYPMEDIGGEISNPQLSGIVLCKGCSSTPIKDSTWIKIKQWYRNFHKRLLYGNKNI